MMLAEMERIIGEKLDESYASEYRRNLSVAAGDYTSFKNKDSDPQFNSKSGVEKKLDLINAIYKDHRGLLQGLSEDTTIFKFAVMPFMAALTTHLSILHDVAKMYHSSSLNKGRVGLEPTSAPVNDLLNDLNMFSTRLSNIYKYLQSERVKKIL